jgi:hypothetical protein
MLKHERNDNKRSETINNVCVSYAEANNKHKFLNKFGLRKWIIYLMIGI